MTARKPLFLHEEILLLALRNERGTVATSYPDYAITGAVLAELLLARRILVDGSRKQLVEIRDVKPMGDPVIDECLGRIREGRRRASLKTWVTRLAGIKQLRHKVARQLCSRGILRADEDKVLFLFTRRIYPEINPVPEREIVGRVRRAIFGENSAVDPRTVVLISLAHGAGLLSENFGRREIRSKRKRIEQIVNGELTGKATKEVIAACEAAVMVAVMMPAMITATTHH